MAGNKSLYFVDFGREFQGGLTLSTKLGRAGTKVTITAGESRQFTSPKNKTDKGPVTQCVGDTWGFEFSWVLMDGSQLLEQYQYTEFRDLNLEFTDDTRATFSPSDDLEICALLVDYEWEPEDTAFNSSNVMLNLVWELNRYTAQAGVLDTFTDNNTRERRSYEAAP